MYIVDCVPSDLIPRDARSALPTPYDNLMIVFRHCPLSSGQGPRSPLREQLLGSRLSLHPALTQTRDFLPDMGLPTSLCPQKTRKKLSAKWLPRNCLPNPVVGRMPEEYQGQEVVRWQRGLGQGRKAGLSTAQEGATMGSHGYRD